MHFARSTVASVGACMSGPGTPREVAANLRAADVRRHLRQYRLHMQLPRPRPWEILIALAGATALVGDALYRGSGSVAIAIPLALIACLPLAWSSEKPLTSLLASTDGLIVCLAVFQTY